MHNEAGKVAGVLCAVLETTDKVIGERRLRLLDALANATSARAKEEACVIAACPMAPLRSTPVALFEPGVPTTPTFECPPALRNLRVLVVDDEKDKRELLAYVLGQCQVQVTLAS